MNARADELIFKMPTPQEAARSYDLVLQQQHELNARARGQEIVYPAPNELFIDIDSAEMEENFKTCLSILQKTEGARFTIKPSPSGKEGRYHAVVKLDRQVDAKERIILQALLGSDPKREMLSWRRLHLGETRPTIFFEKPQVETETSISGGEFEDHIKF